MNVQAFQNIQSACDLVLAETKSSDEKRLLSSANKNLKYSIHVVSLEKSAEKVENNRKKGPPASSERELPESLRKYALSREEISLIGQSCKLVFLVEIKCSPSNRNTKAIKALFDLIVALLSSGIIPTDFNSGIATVEAEGKGGTSILLSKLLGSKESREVSLLQTSEEPENVYLGLVQSTIAGAESLNTRAYPDRLYDAACLALRACITPPLSRDSVGSLSLKPDQLNVSGNELCKMFELLLGYLRNPFVTADVIETSFNAVCKSVVANLRESFIQAGISALDTPLHLEKSVETMVIMGCDSLDRFTSRKSVIPDEISRALLGTRCLLHFFSQIVECEVILLHGNNIVSALKTRVLPSTLSVLRTSDCNTYVQALTIVQYFCYWRGAYTPLNSLKEVFSNVYFRTLLSPRISDAKKVYICNALPMHIQHPFDFVYLFLQRASLSAPSLLEQAIEYLCILSIQSKDLLSILKKGSAEDPMNILSHARYERLAVGEVWKAKDCNGSEALRNSALGSLLEIVLSASRWINATGTSLVSLGSKEEKNVLATKVYGMNGFETMYERILVATDVYQSFLQTFNEGKKPERAIETLQRIPDLVACNSNCNTNQGIHEQSNAMGDIQWKGTWTTQNTAMLLKESDGNVNKVVLGEYFSKCLRHEDILQIFKEWIALQDFRNLTIDEALRNFLGGFKLVGEAQVVDKTMELFAEHFFQQNSSAFQSFDAVFILAFSICMLNTDAHSPHIKNRMKLEEFIQNNRGIDNGSDIDSSILQKIYERISQEEILLRKDNESLNISAIEWIISLFQVFKGENSSSHLAENHCDSRDKKEESETEDPSLNASNEKSTIFSLTEFRDAFVSFASEGVSIDFAASTGPHHQLWMDPMNLKIIWQTVADKVCYTIIDAITNNLKVAEAPLPGADSASGCDPVKKYYEKKENRLYAASLRNAVFHIVRLCAFFCMSSHIETLLESLFALTSLSQFISFSASGVTILAAPSQIRLELLATMMNAFRVYGNRFSSHSWSIGYCTMSFLDAVANGTEGWWRRSAADSSHGGRLSTSSPTSAANMTGLSSSTSSTTVLDRWFGNLEDVPASISPTAISARKKILTDIREATSCSVDAWVDHLFDATRFLPSTRIHLLEGLIACCKVELQQGRSFSLNKLVEFLTICLSTFGYGETFFRLWNSSREVFTSAAESSPEIAVQALEDLLVIILGCLREESSASLGEGRQKELLQPLEDIFAHAKAEMTKMKVLSVVQDLLERSAAVLRDGWPIILFTLRGAASTSASCCREGWELIMRMTCLSTNSNCPWASFFFFFLDCLDAFSSSCFATESMCLTVVSLLVACCRWTCIGWLDLGEVILGKDDIPGKVARWGVTLHSFEEGTPCNVGKNGYDAGSSFPMCINTREKAKAVKRLLNLLRTATQHCFPRVRAHAIASMWELFKVYGRQWGSLFSELALNNENKCSREKGKEGGSDFCGLIECLKGFYFPMIRRTIFFEHTKSLRGGSMAANVSFDRFDYRLLVQLALKGMWTAVLDVQVEDCVHLVIDFWTRCLWHTPITLQLLENELIASVISSFSDLFQMVSVPAGSLSAVTASTLPTTMMTSEEENGERRYSLDENEKIGLERNDETRNNGFFSKWTLFTDDQVDDILFCSTHQMFSSWMAELKRASPIVVRDLARFATWEELFHTGAASVGPLDLHLSPPFSDRWIASSSTSWSSICTPVPSFLSSTEKSCIPRLIVCIRECILRGLEGLRRRMVAAMQEGTIQDRGDEGSHGVETEVGSFPRRSYQDETWELYLQNYRLTLLAVGRYVVHTRDAQGLWLFYHGLRFSWQKKEALPSSFPVLTVPTPVPPEEPCHSSLQSNTKGVPFDSFRGLGRAGRNESSRDLQEGEEAHEIDTDVESMKPDLPPAPSFMLCPSQCSTEDGLPPLPVCAELQIAIPITMGVLQLTLLSAPFFFLPPSPQSVSFMVPISVEVENVLVAISELFLNQLIQSRAFCLEDQRHAYRLRKKSDRVRVANTSMSLPEKSELSNSGIPSKVVKNAGETGEERRHGPPSIATPHQAGVHTGGSHTTFYTTTVPSSFSSVPNSSTSAMPSTPLSSLHPSSFHRVTQYFAFTAVFQECCMTSTTPSGRVVRANLFPWDSEARWGERRYQEWCYLMCLLSIKLLLSTTSISSSPSSLSTTAYPFVLSCVPVEVQLDLISHLPGVLEESAATELFRLYWSALSLDAECPSSFILMEFIQLVKDSHKALLSTPPHLNERWTPSILRGATEGAEERVPDGTRGLSVCSTRIFTHTPEEVLAVPYGTSSSPSIPSPLSPLLSPDGRRPCSGGRDNDASSHALPLHHPDPKDRMVESDIPCNDPYTGPTNNVAGERSSMVMDGRENADEIAVGAHENNNTTDFAAEEKETRDEIHEKGRVTPVVSLSFSPIIPTTEEPNPIPLGSSFSASSTARDGPSSYSLGGRLWNSRRPSLTLTPNTLLDVERRVEVDILEEEEEREQRRCLEEEESAFGAIEPLQKMFCDQHMVSIQDVECGCLNGAMEGEETKGVMEALDENRREFSSSDEERRRE